jgi:hypothetical protein
MIDDKRREIRALMTREDVEAWIETAELDDLRLVSERIKKHVHELREQIEERGSVQ